MKNPALQFPPVPSPRRGGLGRGDEAGTRAFTLIEVVLAIGLTAMVVYLLSTATEMYLSNVDANRTRVETSQLARTLLDQIASDLANARLAPPAAANPPGGGGGQFPGGTPNSNGAPTGGMANSQNNASGGAPGMAGGGASAGGAPSSGGGTQAPPVSGEGLYGDAEQLRIDRAAYANWERASREVELHETATSADMPVSVRYFFVDDNRLSTQRLAQQGVAREVSPTGVGGLYRETIATATITPKDPPLPTRGAVRNGAHVELLAPEVVAFALKYYDGTELVEEWNPVIDRGLPRAVEITLTIAEPRFQPRPNQEELQRLADGRYLESELVEYQRFVRLPLVAASPAAQMLLPAPGAQGAVQPGGNGQPGGAQPGGGQTGGAQPGGTP